MRKKRSAAYGGEADLDSSRHATGAGRKRRREAHIRLDFKGAARIDAAEPRWVGLA